MLKKPKTHPKLGKKVERPKSGIQKKDSSTKDNLLQKSFAVAIV